MNVMRGWRKGQWSGLSFSLLLSKPDGLKLDVLRHFKTYPKMTEILKIDKKDTHPGVNVCGSTFTQPQRLQCVFEVNAFKSK